MQRMLSTSAVLLTLCAPVFAQDPEPAPAPQPFAQPFVQDPDVFVQLPELPALPALLAQAPAPPEPPAPPSAAQERAAARAEARAAAQAERAAARGAGKGIGAGSGPFVFTGAFDADALYDAARQAIENSQYKFAIQNLDRMLSDAGKGRADAALYWKAYSQSKLDLDVEALDTVKQLTKEFAASPWVRDAKALALEIQQANGQPVSAELQNDEELKLLALRGVMQADPDKGVPIIEKMLAGGASPRVRDRALFVLSQSRSARAREVILNTAKNNANPDMQRSAIRYLGMMGGATDLDGIYRSASDASVKRAILQSYFMSNNADRTIDIAKNEKDADLRRAAIHYLGIMRGSAAAASDALVSIYKADPSSDIRRAVVNSLFLQRNARGLVELARAEKDSSMKREIVSKLSLMKEPEATDYMLELLK